ncbi:hypothetical protein PTSG_07705 [Salpingoeca rosetta]|uniref:N-acetyltransferase domain-containing protein n=1 Tax=Salpingoeca rosetta (strain ATCC 50818 / BSB-021) TaxID=946362 RepID=F2UHI9_SALR5|nr:uncharacterized protein PTSG_07705 [Salpingoeca rosetta]EGD76588.1 hypothetical protein PTSG_07705 [Salpingoeca rosetta]|eukprot:XP_004991502.1 hypothetical protein PTSG_07705 [Salpingoeca rosetta]
MRVVAATAATFEGRPAVLQRLVDIINEAYMYGEGDIFREGFQRTSPADVEGFAKRQQLLVVVEDTATDDKTAQAATTTAAAEEEGQQQQQQQARPALRVELDSAEHPLDWPSIVTEASLIGCMKLVVHDAKQARHGQGRQAEAGDAAQTSEAARDSAGGEEAVPSAHEMVKRGEVGMFAVRRDLRSKGIGKRLFDAAEARAQELNCDVCELQLLYPRDRPHANKDRLRKWYTRRGYRVVASSDFCAMLPHIAALINGPVCFDIYHKPLPPPPPA